jgi:hypothetical protein
MFLIKLGLSGCFTAFGFAASGATGQGMGTIRIEGFAATLAITDISQHVLMPNPVGSFNLKTRISAVMVLILLG